MAVSTNQSALSTQLKRTLWERYGSAAYPAEWDGHIYGGGKISQRYWEYFKAIELLDLSDDATVLDIGGGSPITGLSFFGGLLAASGISVVVMDENIRPASTLPPHVSILPRLAGRGTLTEALRYYRPTHLSCISVLEHASPADQLGIFEAVDEAFEGSRFVCTLEFHETTTFFEYQMTTTSLSAAVSRLNRYFLSQIEACPIHCVNSFPSTFQHTSRALVNEPPLERLWFPLALCFTRAL
jgi:hypothetical protein